MSVLTNPGEKLAVMTPVFNPQGYDAIYRNYERFAKHMATFSNVDLFTVECAFADRPHLVTEAANPRHLQVRGWSIMWLKERLGNLLLRTVPYDYAKIGWFDADIEFLEADAMDRAIAALDHYDIIQPWSEAIYGGPDGEFTGRCRSFMSQYASRETWPGHPPQYGELWHPGFAWCYRRSALRKLGGLYDKAIVGHGDSHMAQAYVGLAEQAVTANPKFAADKRGGLTEAYRETVREYERRAERHIRRNVGFTPGMIRHFWHGRQVDRRYEDRWAIPVDNHYDPSIHLVENEFGVYEWSEHHGIGHRDDTRDYFRGRRDDANVR